MFRMILLVLLVFNFSLLFSSAQEVGRRPNATRLRNKWFGPSYQPSWWNIETADNLRTSDFGYEGANNPVNWGKEFPECNGSKQSPIDIKTKNLVSRKTKKPLKWNSYSTVPRSAVAENSKHSVHINGAWRNARETPSISHGPLEKRYYFSQLHFHWGKRNDRGSEHLIDGNSYPLEMHVVHDRTPEDQDDEQLVVVAYMFQLTKNDNPNLKPILDGAREVQGSKKRKYNIKPFALDTIVKPFSGDYVTYKGSLTTPPCTEGVVWIINSKPLGISERQLNVLRNSVRGRSDKAFDNFRPVQPLNGRHVYYVPC